MGIFKMFKKKKVEPSPPPVPGGDIKAPIAFDNNEAKVNTEENQFQDPFSSEQNMPPPPESPDSFTPSQNNPNFNEIPEPPEFEKIDETNPFQNNMDKPFNPDVPNVAEQKQNDFSNEIPSPFDQENQNNENNNFQNKIPTFAEKFGTKPVDDTLNQNQEIEKNIDENQNTQPEENPQFEEQDQTDVHDEDHDEDHEEFSFSNEKNNLLSESELPLEDVSDKIETNFNQISKKINSNENIEKEIHTEQNKKENVNEKIKEKVEIKSKDKKEFINSGDSYFLSAEATLSIFDLINDIKSDINNSNEVQSKILDIEKNSETQYSKWKKNKEEIHSLLLSMDKKLFR